jgi:hypothetical protein
MVTLAATYDGFLGIEPARNTDGTDVAAIYWKTLIVLQLFLVTQSISSQRRRGAKFGTHTNSHYMIRICKVEREYGRSD